MADKELKAKDDSPEEYDEYFKVLKDLNPARATYRVRKGMKLIGTKGGKALSVGAGNLSEARELKKHGLDVVICDISPLAIRYAQENEFEAFQCDISGMVPMGEYDFVFCFEVLEHLVNPLKAVENLKTSLKQDGKLVISLPNEFNFIARLQILFGKPPFGGHNWHHLRFFNEKFGEKMFLEANMEIIEKSYCPRIPLWNQISILIGEKLQDLMPNLFSFSIVWLLKPR
jgi:2-polyprenyl-3-methyl-5-hydroxy-6-metoxy-1,4-benzoquinol methylase